MMGPYRWVNAGPFRPGETHNEEFDRVQFPGLPYVATFWADPEVVGSLTTQSITTRVRKNDDGTTSNKLIVTVVVGGETEPELRNRSTYILTIKP
jgi:hypothetical protein